MGNINVDYDVLNQKGSPAWYSDIFANIPTPGYTGRMFISTDTFAFYRDNGTGWDLTGGPGTGTITGSGVSGQVTFFNGSATIGGSTNLVWDNTNNRLGIGVASPTVTLEISGSVKATALIKSGGTSAQILLADGTTTPTSTFQSAITLTTTGTTGASTLVGATLNVPTYTFVSSVNAITLGTSGTDLSSTVANSTTTPTITLNVPTASATNRGALSSADWTTFNNKQATITLTTTGTSGAATLVGATLNVPNYTNVGTVTSVAALTLGTSGTDLSSTVANSTSTPVITLNVPTASGSNRGALSSADWTTFNSKQATISVTAPVVLTGATISMPAATTSVNGYLTSTDWNTFNNKSNTNGTVTSVVALTIGTSGIDITSTAVTTTTTPVITLNIPTASASNRGALSSTDWTTFNNKQATITLTTTGTSGAATFSSNTLNIPQYQGVLSNPVTGTGTTNYLPKFTGASTIGNSQIFDNGTTVFINALTAPALGSPEFFVKMGTANTYEGILVASSSNNNVIAIAHTGTQGIITTNYGTSGSNTPLAFGTNGAAQMTLSTSGNLMVGSTDAGNAGSINVSVGLAGTTSGGLQLWAATNQTHYLQFGDGTTGASPYTGYLGYAHSTDSLIFGTATSTKMTLTSSGNLGLGVTPSAWTSVHKVIQFGAIGSIETDNDAVAVSNNRYFDGTNRYSTNDFASIYVQVNGSHVWYTAPSGTAGNAISFTQAMTLNASGNLSVGNTNDTYKLDVNGTGRFSSSVTTNGNIVYINGEQPETRYTENDVGALPLGLWRTVLGGDAFYVQKNTAVAGDFSTATNCLIFSNTGAATFSDLAGTGTRVVEASSAGLLSATKILDEGTYTPTKSGGSGSWTSITMGLANWTRVGDRVTVWGTMDATSVSGISTLDFYITIPITSTNSTGGLLIGNDLIIGGTINNGNMQGFQWSTTQFYILLQSDGLYSHQFTYTYTYLI